MKDSSSAQVMPFFLNAAPGSRFCLYYPPAHGPCRMNVLYIHAFAEEMNKSRRMVALQARSLSEMGIGVLVMDLYGCGDSDGDFADARWEIWRDDIAHAVRWLKRRADAPLALWGLRLGVPLMLSYARDSGEAFECLLMWQPVISGDVHLTQFLRLRLANEMLAGAATRTGTRELKESLKAGHILEIAGYELSPQLAGAMEGISLAALGPPASACHWFEITHGAPEILPAGRRVIEEWKKCGISPATHVVTGEPFWATQEIVECPTLIAATSRALEPVPV